MFLQTMFQDVPADDVPTDYVPADDVPAYTGPYRRQSYDSLLGSFRHSSRQGSDTPPRKRLRL